MTHSIRRITETDTIYFESFMASMFAENLPTLVPRGTTPSPEQVKAYILRHITGNNAVFLAEIHNPAMDNNIVGSIALTCFGRPQLDHVAGLGLNVAADFRGQGIGRALLQHALQWAKQSSTIERIELEVIDNNASAIHLYEHFGFQREGTKRNAVKKPERYFDMHIYGLVFNKRSFNI